MQAEETDLSLRRPAVEEILRRVSAPGILLKECPGVCWIVTAAIGKLQGVVADCD